MKKISTFTLLFITFCCQVFKLSAENFFRRLDNMLTQRYDRGKVDSIYVTRPQTKWTILPRMNVSGSTISTEGIESRKHFKSEMDANRKATVSVGVSYLGFGLNFAINPAQMAGKYRDFEVNFNSYGRKFGFDIIYQNAKNFNGWYERDDINRIEMPDGMLSIQTLNLNAFYVFNNHKFSYPAAFSQSYIQRRSAGSFLLAASGMFQRATLDWDIDLKLRMTNIGIGAGYGYNIVPGHGWLLHVSALPTIIVYSSTSLTIDNIRTPIHYNFPEVILTGRAAVIHQWSNKFAGLSMVFTYTANGKEDNLAIHNVKWRLRMFFGIRLGKR